MSGVYREVVANEKLVFTWAWRSTPERESLVTVHLKADGDHTIMTFTHEQFFDEDARDRHEHGWTGTFQKLDTYLHLASTKEAGMSPHGKFVWNELNTHDVEAAKKFLSATLGWTFDAMPMPEGTYWIIKNGDDRIGGIFDMNTIKGCENIPEHWLSYVAVDDVDRRLKQALAAGGKPGRPTIRCRRRRPHRNLPAARRRDSRMDDTEERRKEVHHELQSWHPRRMAGGAESSASQGEGAYPRT